MSTGQILYPASVAEKFNWLVQAFQNIDPANQGEIEAFFDRNKAQILNSYGCISPSNELINPEIIESQKKSAKESLTTLVADSIFTCYLKKNELSRKQVLCSLFFTTLEPIQKIFDSKPAIVQEDFKQKYLWSWNWTKLNLHLAYWSSFAFQKTSSQKTSKISNTDVICLAGLTAQKKELINTLTYCSKALSPIIQYCSKKKRLQPLVADLKKSQEIHKSLTLFLEITDNKSFYELFREKVFIQDYACSLSVNCSFIKQKTNHLIKQQLNEVQDSLRLIFRSIEGFTDELKTVDSLTALLDSFFEQSEQALEKRDREHFPLLLSSKSELTRKLNSLNGCLERFVKEVHSKKLVVNSADKLVNLENARGLAFHCSNILDLLPILLTQYFVFQRSCFGSLNNDLIQRFLQTLNFFQYQMLLPESLKNSVQELFESNPIPKAWIDLLVSYSQFMQFLDSKEGKAFHLDLVELQNAAEPNPRTMFKVYSSFLNKFVPTFVEIYSATKEIELSISEVDSISEVSYFLAALVYKPFHSTVRIFEHIFNFESEKSFAPMLAETDLSMFLISDCLDPTLADDPPASKLLKKRKKSKKKKVIKLQPIDKQPETKNSFLIENNIKKESVPFEKKKRSPEASTSKAKIKTRPPQPLQPATEASAAPPPVPRAAPQEKREDLPLSSRERKQHVFTAWLEDHGWILSRNNKHQIYTHPAYPGRHLTVPSHPTLKFGTAYSIAKDALEAGSQKLTNLK